MCDFEDVEIIASYPLGQAIEDGVLVKLSDIRWSTVTKPLIATSNILGGIGRDKIMEVWQQYIDWRTNVMPTLPEEEQMFVTKVDGQKVWLIEDGASFTVMLPEDY
jgi:hypothetical protein